MLTNKITGFSADLLNTVRGILGEAKKCPADCECEKCEAEDEDEKEMKEGSMPTADEPTDANKKTADKVRAMLAKEKKPVKEEAKEDLPFEGPYRKTGDRKDEYGNKVKNVAKHLAKKAMNKQKNEEVEQVDEISSDMAYSYLRGKRERDYDISADGKSSTLKKPQSFGKMNKDMKSTMRALRTIEKSKKTNEEVEELDETAKIVAHLQKRYGDNIRKSHVVSAANDFGVDASKLAKAVRAKLGKNMLDEEDDGWYTHSQMHGSKKSEKHPKGISAAEWKSGIRWHHGKNKRINIKEEVEQIDELSKGTMGRYINKAKDSIDTASYRQGHKEAHGSSSKALEKKLTKRHKGIETAVKKLTREDAEQIDELKDKTLGSYIKKAATKIGTQGVTAGLKIAKDERSQKNFDTIGKRERGIALAVKKLTKEEQDFVDALNADTLDEARGRPRKAGAKDFTIHPKTKEKLMHNNPEHMKKIEVLQKNGILEKPKVEAGQHIMNQLRKAKTSMLGGSKINFTHGDSKEVSGTHAAKILTKYAGMKPDEKEAFQKFVGHSHENLMKHV